MTYREAVEMCAMMRKTAEENTPPSKPAAPAADRPTEWTWTDEDKSRTLWGGGYGALAGSVIGGLLGGARGFGAGLLAGGLGGAAMGYGRNRLGAGMKWWGNPLWNEKGQVYTGLPWDRERGTTDWSLPWYGAGDQKRPATT